MAKNKHQKLADMMQTMLRDIEEHHQKVAMALNVVQLHFYERLYLIGRPLMKPSALRSMFCAHYVGLQHFAVDSVLKTKCRELPMFGALIQRDLFLRSECKQSTGDGIWFIPWGVKILLPEENREKLDKGMKRSLLYCPAHEELACHIDWFEQEDAGDSISHQMHSFMFYEAEKVCKPQSISYE